MKKKRYRGYVVGDNTSKSLSPTIFNYWFSKYKINGEYNYLEINIKKFEEEIKKILKDPSLCGLNITIPYKEKIIKYLDKVDVNSKKINSINTILKKNNKLIGFNTDYSGFGRSLNKFNIKKKDAILVLGAGGAGKAAISFIINNFKENKKYFFNRTPQKLTSFLKTHNKKKIFILKNYKSIYKITNIKLVVNTTSIGFNSWFYSKRKFYNLKYFSPLAPLKQVELINKKENKLFLKKNKQNIERNIKKSKQFFKDNPNAKVYDIIYTPIKTNIMKHADIFKSFNLNGLNMNLDQAVIAFSKVNKIKSFDEIKKIMKK